MVKCQCLTSLAVVKRVEKSKIYPKGTLYIQVSACKRGGEEAWNILDEESTLEDKYAVVIPNIEIIPEYLKIALDYQTPSWHARYVGTNINISMSAFDYFEIEYDSDLEKQKRCVEMIKVAEKAIAEEQSLVDDYKQMKAWYLTKMFVRKEGNT